MIRTIVVVLIALIAMMVCSTMAEEDDAYEALYGQRVMTPFRFGKRSPSMGLSLAEYMANPQPQRGFHFLANRK